MYSVSNILTRLQYPQSVYILFHTLTVLWENGYFYKTQCTLLFHVILKGIVRRTSSSYNTSRCLFRLLFTYSISGRNPHSHNIRNSRISPDCMYTAFPHRSVVTFRPIVLTILNDYVKIDSNICSKIKESKIPGGHDFTKYILC